jgi:L-rhamnose mutarotase
MKRNAFKMKLKAGFAEEYQKRHDEIWPELQQHLSASGIQDYAIYLDEETNILFAVQKLADDFREEDVSTHPIVRKWWDYMADIMDTHPDNEPVAKPLREVFYMD